MSSRLALLRERLKNQGLQAMLVMQPQNRCYLSGFTGSTGWLLVSDEHAVIMTDSRYWEQVGRECSDFELFKVDNKIPDAFPLAAAENVGCLGLSGPLAFEAEFVSYALHREIQAAIPDIQLQPVDDLIEQLRMVKEPQEIEAMREAARIADEALAAVSGLIRPGTTEQELAANLQFQMRLRGADKDSFDAIVASGPNGALPHARPSDRRFGEHELVTIDFGAMWRGYNSDMTRTVSTGRVDGELADVYRLVRRAQQTALEALRPGLSCSAADAIARDIIAEAGHGEHFGHGLGHGVGLAVHEIPWLNRRDDTVLAEGMVVTVEPGVYLPQLGGVRIEDMAVITADGFDVLTRAPKMDL